ncbi:MAG: 3-dehydroquinate synthase II [Candidatus Altiarchaeota archaeon]|nr:3-dehydroquinate synthase II [Candidatus Altiarchaeota archaeon]
MSKLFWVAADGNESWETRKKRVTTALESGADGVLVNLGEAAKVRELGHIPIISPDRDSDVVMTEKPSKNEKTAIRTRIASKDDEKAAMAAADHSDFVLVSTTDWKVIPLENLIAGVHKKKSKLIAEVSSIPEAELALETLEIGVDGVLFKGKLTDISKLKEAIEAKSSQHLRLRKAKITDLKPVGMGDRVCVDTCSIFNMGEGMLVGSQSNALFLVHSETVESKYVAARPFRVNAGPVHAYTMMPDGKTKYLSELGSGDDILAVSAEGKTRVLVVGRVKIEKRPLMLVEANVDGRTVKTILQNAETIRLVNPNHKPVSIAGLKRGDEVLVYVEDEGRHFGMKVKESIDER